MPNLLPLITLCSAFAGSVSALNMPFRRDAAHSTTVNFKSKSSTDADGDFNFTNNNAGQGSDIYVGTILVNGSPFEVQLDTGSSDLWLDTAGIDLKGFTNTKIDGRIAYGDKTVATGPILIGNVTFGDFVVQKQAFISAPGSNATSNGDKGLLGIGPPTLSTIADKLASSSYNGNSFLDNVFSYYPAEPNFMTFSLSRSEMGITDGGVFTIGEIPEEYSAINDTPTLEVIPQTGSVFWAINIDAVVIDGHQYSGHAPASGSGGMSAILDTGTALATAPSYYVDAMYKSIHGATFDSDSGMYTVPCDSKVDINIVIGKYNFPIDPIDATVVAQDTDGTVLCFGAFSYGTDGFLLGDTFLRNVFALYDFGNWTTVADSAPFVKLLSVTNATEADAAFESLNNARVTQLGNTSSTGSKSSKDLSAAPTSTGSSGSSTVDLSPLMRNSYIIIGLLAAVILILIVGIVVLRGNKAYRVVPTIPEAAGDHHYSTPYDMPYKKY